jgi:hypothetical protein
MKSCRFILGTVGALVAVALLGVAHWAAGELCGVDRCVGRPDALRQSGVVLFLCFCFVGAIVGLSWVWIGDGRRR